MRACWMLPLWCPANIPCLLVSLHLLLPLPREAGIFNSSKVLLLLPCREKHASREWSLTGLTSVRNDENTPDRRQQISADCKRTGAGQGWVRSSPRGRWRGGSACSSREHSRSYSARYDAAQSIRTRCSSRTYARRDRKTRPCDRADRVG